MQDPTTTTNPEGAPWPTLLERVIQCPSCGAPGLGDRQAPRCSGCGFEAEWRSDILSLVAPEWLHEGHDAEVQAQTAAVNSYYENEERLTCHWDRLSADELPELLGWPQGLVLDLGCGTGTAGVSLRNSSCKVLGADLSLACLEVAQRRLDAVVRVDANHLPFPDETFDALVSRGCLHHLDDADRGLAEASRVVKSGARVVFSDPREWAWLEPIKDTLRKTDDSFTHEHHAYTPEEYRDLVARHFEIESESCRHPAAILVAHGLDLLPVPKAIPRRALAKTLLSIDRALDKTPLAKAGHLLTIVARKR